MTKLNVYAIALIAVSCVTLSGCASWTPLVSTKAMPSGHESYLYGSFKIDTFDGWGGFDGYKTMGFVFHCADNNEYTIRFDLEHPVEVIQVAPSACSLKETIFTDGDGRIMGSKPTPEGFLKKIVLKPGVAYYIGDYVGSARSAYDRPLKHHIEWRLKKARDAYSETTRLMKTKRYPNLSAVPTEDIVSDLLKAADPQA